MAARMKPPSLSHAVLNVLPGLAAVTAIGGAAIYATIWWGYVSFYSDLGLAPGDVGLAQVDVVRTAGLALFLFAAFAVPVGATWWLVLEAGAFLLKRIGRRLVRPTAARRLEAYAHKHRLRLTLALLALVLSGLRVVRLHTTFIFCDNFRLYTLSATGALLAAIVFSGFVQRRPWTATSSSAMVWSVALGVVLVSAMSFLQVRGNELAQNLIHGQPPYDSQFIFQIQRQPVCIVTNGQGRPAVFLGESASGVVLFDRNSQVILRPTVRPSLVNHPPPNYDC